MYKYNIVVCTNIILCMYKYNIVVCTGPTVLAKGERPKTEDFLTFLCLRGTEHLPPELDFFNQVSRIDAILVIQAPFRLIKRHRGQSGAIYVNQTPHRFFRRHLG